MAWKRLPIRQMPAGWDLVPSECERCGAAVLTEDGKRTHERWHAEQDPA
jgi:hypothetical protein